jgi:hypothetical protein
MFTEWSLLQCPSQTIAVCFDQMLTEASVSKIAWTARMSNFNRMIIGTISYVEDIDPEEVVNEALNGTLGSRPDRQKELAAISLYFLVVIGLMEHKNRKGARLTELCVNRLEQMFMEFGPSASGIGKNPEVMATALILFHMWKETNGTFIPGPLLHHSAQVLASTMRWLIEDDPVVCKHCGHEIEVFDAQTAGIGPTENSPDPVESVPNPRTQC